MPRQKKLPPIHPGEVLQEEFLAPLGISQYRLAKDTSVPARGINEIVRGQRSISTDTALRLSRYYGTPERFWTNLQTRYDLEIKKKIAWGHVSIAKSTRSLNQAVTRLRYWSLSECSRLASLMGRVDCQNRGRPHADRWRRQSECPTADDPLATNTVDKENVDVREEHDVAFADTLTVPGYSASVYRIPIK